VTNGAPVSGAALLKRIKPRLARANAHICLRPDLLTEHEALSTQLTESMMKDRVAAGGNPEKPRLGQGGDPEYSEETQKIAGKIEALEKQIDAADVTFRFEALPKDEWESMVASHPPRPNNHFDMLAGYNRNTALDTAVRKCLYDPLFEDCADAECDHKECGTWQAFLRVCASSEWEELRNVAASVNTESGDNPKSVLASRVLSSSAGASKSPKRTGSRSGSSTAGRRAR
jgi:hypothetical protein